MRGFLGLAWKVVDFRIVFIVKAKWSLWCKFIRNTDMSIGLVGKKCGMTRVFTEDGVSIPVTVIEVAHTTTTGGAVAAECACIYIYPVVVVDRAAISGAVVTKRAGSDIKLTVVINGAAIGGDGLSR